MSQGAFPLASIVIVLAALVSSMSVGPAAAAAPSPPQAHVDTTYPQRSGNTIVVNAGGSFQAALNSAQLGDTIVLQAGATFRGPFTLPAKSGSGRIVITSSAILPAEGTCVTPADAAQMPKLEASVDGVIVTTAGAHGYRFVGIELRPTSGVFLFNLVLLGTNTETTLGQLPRDIVFDRCRNLRTIDVLIDREAVATGRYRRRDRLAVLRSLPRLLHLQLLRAMPHRMACARCDFYLPKASSCAQLSRPRRRCRGCWPLSP